MSLTPELTELDRRVLAAVQGPARRARSIAEDLTPPPYGKPHTWTLEAQLRHGRAVEVRYLEVLRILRGLEHLGFVTHTDNGWWKAT